jgi:hypothetical protein
MQRVNRAMASGVLSQVPKGEGPWGTRLKKIPQGLKPALQLQPFRHG